MISTKMHYWNCITAYIFNLIYEHPKLDVEFTIHV